MKCEQMQSLKYTFANEAIINKVLACTVLNVLNYLTHVCNTQIEFYFYRLIG
jgi:hypothetical protein